MLDRITPYVCVILFTFSNVNLVSVEKVSVKIVFHVRKRSDTPLRYLNVLRQTISLVSRELSYRCNGFVNLVKWYSVIREEIFRVGSVKNRQT